jgi:uncharacterized membrane protein HdeD (DUF308 family)
MTDATKETTMDRPPFDPIALVLGVVFVVIAAIALLDPEVARRVDLGVVWSLTFVAVGIALLASSLGRRGAAAGARDADRA